MFFFFTHFLWYQNLHSSERNKAGMMASWNDHTPANQELWADYSAPVLWKSSFFTSVRHFISSAEYYSPFSSTTEPKTGSSMTYWINHVTQHAAPRTDVFHSWCRVWWKTRNQFTGLLTSLFTKHLIKIRTWIPKICAFWTRILLKT